MTVAPVVKSEIVAVSKLVEHPLNWAEHPPEQLDAVRAIIEKYGWRQPLTVNRRSGFVIDGHARLTIARDAGWTHVPVSYVDLDETEELELLAAYNQSARLAGTDEAALAGVLTRLAEQGIDAPIGYDDEFVRELLERVEPLPPPDGLDVAFTAGPMADPKAEPEEPALPEEIPARCRPGDLWTIGPHRLLIGDCRAPESLERLMEGDRAAGIFTSPWYAEQRQSQYGGIPAAEYNDWWEPVQAMAAQCLDPEGSFFLNIKPHVEAGQRVLYVFDLVLAMVRRWDWLFIDELCWRHHGYPVGHRHRFKNEFEPVYQFARTRRPQCYPDAVREESIHAQESLTRMVAPTPGDRKFKADYIEAETGSGFVNMGRFSVEDALYARPGNVIECHVSQLRQGHPAAFPAGLPRWFMQAYSAPGAIWLDPFAGAGTVAVAAHETDREARLVEIIPEYGDVTLVRIERLLGQAAVLKERL